MNQQQKPERILAIEKTCELDEITQAELLASKFLSVFHHDLEGMKKIDRSVEAVNDTIHEYMYEKMNESIDPVKATKIKHVDRRQKEILPTTCKSNSQTLIASDAVRRA